MTHPWSVRTPAADPTTTGSGADCAALHDTLVSGLLASALSTATLAWRGRTDNGSAAAPLNAVSHWLWGDEALRRDDATAAHTLLGTAVHAASALLWAAVYGWLRERRDEPTALNAATDAAAVTALAALVDLRLVPKRLTPGFERRLGTGSLTTVYGAVGVGLAIGGWLALRRRRGGA